MSNTGHEPSPNEPEFQPEGGQTPSFEQPAYGQSPTQPDAGQSADQPYVAPQAPYGPAGGQAPQDPSATGYQQQPDGAPQGPGTPGSQDAPFDPYAAAAAAGYTDPQQPAPQKKDGINLKALIPILLAIAIGGWALWSNFGPGSATAEAGECLVMSGTHEDVSHEEVDCDDVEQFSYIVGSVHEGEVACALDEVPFTSGTERFGNFTVDETLCLVENFHVDQCYDFTTDVQGFERVDCGSVTNGFRVTDKIDQAEASCTNGENLWTYSEPPLTYCGEQP